MEGLVFRKATLPSFTHRPNKFSIKRSVLGPTMDLHTRKSVSFASSSIRAQQVLTFLLIFSFTTSSLQSSTCWQLSNQKFRPFTTLYHLWCHHYNNHNNIYIYIYILEFQFIMSTLNDNFIIKSKYQSIFGVDGNWTLNFLFNYNIFFFQLN